MKARLQYFGYIARHKWFVFLEACRLGIPWLGLVHDWTKLLPGEWEPYVEHFYMLPRSGQERVEAFDHAWNHHQKANRHHWQYWILSNDDGSIYPLPMPDRYRREMLADWRGAGKAQGRPDTAKWYMANRDKIVLATETRRWVEQELGVREVTDGTG